MNNFLIFLLILSILIVLNFNQVNAQENSGNYIVVYGYKYTMYVFNSQAKLLKTYKIGIGINGMGKTREGDKKTPLGEYEIIWKATKFQEDIDPNNENEHFIEDGYAFAGPDNIFTTDPEIGYSSEQLWTEGYGGDEAVVLCINYPNALDKSKGYTGGCIEIHATHLGGIGQCSSYGCLRMHPGDAREVYNLVEVGAKVYINE